MNKWRLERIHFVFPYPYVWTHLPCSHQTLTCMIAIFLDVLPCFFLSVLPKNFKSVHQNIFVEMTNTSRKMNNSEVQSPISSLSASLRPQNRKCLPSLSFITCTMSTINLPQYHGADGVCERGLQTARHHTKLLLNSLVRFCKLPHQSLVFNMANSKML